MKSFIKRGWKPDPPPIPVVRPHADTSSNQLTINQNTMFKNIKPTWEGAFYLLLWVATLLFMCLLTIFIISKKYTHAYTLGGSSGGTLKINKEIDWSPDETITLDRNITYGEAIRIVDSLNRTLK